MESVRRTASLAKALTTTDRPITRDPADMRHRARALLRALDVTLDADAVLLGADTTAQPAVGTHTPGTLVVANHVSWLDILALSALEPVTFVAKREVGEWPLVGRTARRRGTVLLDRRSLRGLPDAVAAVAARLRAGRTVVAFPEATTWCGPPGGPFRRAVFQAAIDAGAPIRPVTLTYTQRGRPATVAAYVGDDSLAASLTRVVRARGLAVRVTAHTPLSPTADRAALAEQAHRAVRGEGAHV